MRRAAVTFASLLMCACNQIEETANWSRFRGPNGSGVSEAVGLPVEFGPHHNILWRTTVPFSRSSPILAGGRIFLTAIEGDKLLTICLDEDTGDVIWRREIARERGGEIYRGNDPASPSPVSDGENVFVFFPDLGIVSYGLDGTERWRLPLGPFNSFYGMGSSPILAGDILLLNCDQQGDSFLIAVNKKDGKVRWKAERPDRWESWSTPSLHVPEAGPSQVIVVGRSWLDGYSVATGERLWSMSGTAQGAFGVPNIHGSKLFVYGVGNDASPWPPHAEFLEQYDEDGDGTLVSAEVQEHPVASEHYGFLDLDKDGYVDAHEYNHVRELSVSNYGIVAVQLGGRGLLAETDVLWRRKKAVPNVPAPVLYDGALYTVKNGRIIATIDPTTGEELQMGRTTEAMDDYYSSLVAADGKVYMVSETGKITVLEAGRPSKILAVNELAEDCCATPAIGDGRIYIRTREAMYSFADLTPRPADP